MDRNQYETAKSRLEEVTRILKYEKISTEERDRLEQEGKRLARIVMSPWVPFDWRYRAVMAALVAVGVWGLMQADYLFVLAWVLLPLFSPRIMGELIRALSGSKDW